MEKSQSIKNIAKAIGLFQVKMSPIKKDSTNPFFKSKYASLSTILEQIQVPLQECGLSFSQFPDGDGLTTIVMHDESGEFMQASYNIHAAKQDPQGIGSAITYARRYALASILGLNIDEDDDGNAATGKNGQSEEKKSGVTPNAAAEDNRPWITEKQVDAIIERIKTGEADVLEKTKKAFKISKALRAKLESAKPQTA